MPIQLRWLLTAACTALLLIGTAGLAMADDALEEPSGSATVTATATATTTTGGEIRVVVTDENGKRTVKILKLEDWVTERAKDGEADSPPAVKGAKRVMILGGAAPDAGTPGDAKSPLPTVLGWLLGEATKLEAAGGPLEVWFEGDDVPLKGLRDALKRDGWTASSLKAWFAKHVDGPDLILRALGGARRGQAHHGKVRLPAAGTKAPRMPLPRGWCHQGGQPSHYPVPTPYGWAWYPVPPMMPPLVPPIVPQMVPPRVSPMVVSPRVPLRVLPRMSPVVPPRLSPMGAPKAPSKPMKVLRGVMGSRREGAPTIDLQGLLNPDTLRGLGALVPPEAQQAILERIASGDFQKILEGFDSADLEALQGMLPEGFVETLMKSMQARTGKGDVKIETVIVKPAGDCEGCPKKGDCHGKEQDSD